MRKVVAFSAIVVIAVLLTEATLVTRTAPGNASHVLTVPSTVSLPFSGGGGNSSTSGGNTPSLGAADNALGNGGGNPIYPNPTGGTCNPVTDSACHRGPGSSSIDGAASGTSCDPAIVSTCGSSTGSAASGTSCGSQSDPTCGSSTGSPVFVVEPTTSTSTTSTSTTSTSVPSSATTTGGTGGTALPVGVIGAPLLALLLGGAFALAQVRRRRSAHRL